MRTRKLKMYQYIEKLHETEELKARFCPIPGQVNRVAFYESNRKKAPCESLIEFVIECAGVVARRNKAAAKVAKAAAAAAAEKARGPRRTSQRATAPSKRQRDADAAKKK